MIIPNFISENVINSVLSETRDALSKVINNKYYDTKSHYFPNYGIYQVLECEKLSPLQNYFLTMK